MRNRYTEKLSSKLLKAVPAVTNWSTEIVKDQNEIIPQKQSRTAVWEQHIF